MCTTVCPKSVLWPASALAGKGAAGPSFDLEALIEEMLDGTDDGLVPDRTPSLEQKVCHDRRKTIILRGLPRWISSHCSETRPRLWCLSRNWCRPLATMMLEWARMHCC